MNRTGEVEKGMPKSRGRKSRGIFSLLLIFMLMFSLGTGAFAATATPTNITATAGDGEITVTWDSVTGAAGYNVYQSTDNTTFTKINGSLIPGTSYTVTGLTNDSTYYFKVTSYDSTDSTESAQSTAVTATPTASGGGGSAMDIFTGVTFNWGFTAADIMTNVMTLFGGLATFVLLGLAIYFAPKIIDLIKKAAS